MANIYEYVEGQKERGFDLIDSEGEFLKSEKLQKMAFKGYQDSVKAKEINPIEISYAEYYEEVLKSYASSNEILEMLNEYLASENDCEEE